MKILFNLAAAENLIGYAHISAGMRFFDPV
jgi:hypothetical protein